MTPRPSAEAPSIRDQAGRTHRVRPGPCRRWHARGSDFRIVDVGSRGQLRNAARVYHLALAVFYLPSPPWEHHPIRDYRRLPSLGEPVVSPDLTLEIRRAYDRRDVVRELLAILDEPVPRFRLRAPLDDDPEDLAGRLRSHLGLTLELQRSWRDPSVAFRETRSLFEQAGVLVFQTTGIPVEEMRGFSIGETAAPVIVVKPWRRLHRARPDRLLPAAHHREHPVRRARVAPASPAGALARHGDLIRCPLRMVESTASTRARSSSRGTRR